MPIKAKTPQKILFEAETMRQKLIAIYGTAIVLEPDWLRSSMQSLLLHVKGEMPKKNQRIATNGIDPDKGEIRDCLSAGYNSAITDCLAVIQSTIDSIKE